MKGHFFCDSMEEVYLIISNVIVMLIRNIKRSFAGIRLRRPCQAAFYYFSQQPNDPPKFDPSKNYYSILQVDKDASLEEINRAYGRLFVKY